MHATHFAQPLVYLEIMDVAKPHQEAAKSIYKPLRKRQIRLVHIHPLFGAGEGHVGSTDDIISCSLSCANLEDHPTYQALSYVWGSHNSPRRIHLNGEPFYITQNLYLVLDRLRLADEASVIWIDALAINQCDIAEWNAQVQIMKNIYSSARETLIWPHFTCHYLGEVIRRLRRSENSFNSLI